MPGIAREVYKREHREGLGWRILRCSSSARSFTLSSPDTRTMVITVLVSSSSGVSEIPIMRFRRRRHDYSDTLKRDALALLVPIAATFAMILLFFYG